MIIDHRTYTVHHGRMTEYLEMYQRVALPIQLRHLKRLLGIFTSEIGPLNQVVHIWAYDSLADRDEKRARMEADPEWQKFKKMNAGIFVEQENKIMRLAPFLPEK